MSGPLTSSGLLLILSCLLLHSPTLQAKPLSAAHVRMRNLDGGMVRIRRDLRDSLPYEAQMMSYSPGAEMRMRANDLYSQPDVWRAKALQQLVENDQRRDQEAAYLAGLMRLMGQIDANNQAGPQEDPDMDVDSPGDFPPDYDETEPVASMVKPRAAWTSQDQLDPQLAQALLNRYRQEGLLLHSAVSRVPEQRDSDQDQEVLRYLVEKILSNFSPAKSQAPSGGRRAKRDVDAASALAGRSRPTPRRARRSLDNLPPPDQDSEQVSLLRVKRLGDEEENEASVAGNEGLKANPQPIGLQRMKRIDVEPQPVNHSRRRRALTYDPHLLAQQILQYLHQ